MKRRRQVFSREFKLEAIRMLAEGKKASGAQYKTYLINRSYMIPCKSIRNFSAYSSPSATNIFSLLTLHRQMWNVHDFLSLVYQSGRSFSSFFHRIFTITAKAVSPTVITVKCTNRHIQ